MTVGFASVARRDSPSLSISASSFLARFSEVGEVLVRSPRARGEARPDLLHRPGDQVSVRATFSTHESSAASTEETGRRALFEHAAAPDCRCFLQQ